MSERQNSPQEVRRKRRMPDWRSGLAFVVAGTAAVGAAFFSHGSDPEQISLVPAATNPASPHPESSPSLSQSAPRNTHQYTELADPNVALVMDSNTLPRTAEACGKLARTQILERGTDLQASEAPHAKLAQVVLAPTPEIDKAAKEGYTSLGVAVTGETGQGFTCSRFEKPLPVTYKSQRVLGGVGLGKAGYVSFIAWNASGEGRPISTGGANLPPTGLGQQLTPAEGPASTAVIPVV